MTEIIKTENSLPVEKKKIDLDTFKSIYYWSNAKPDTQIKFFRKKRKLELSDIHELNERVNKKLATHNVSTYIVTINLLLDEGNLREYGSWAEFQRENWDLVNQRVNSVNMTWDMTFKLDGYELPQRHTMKVRIGNAIPPKDMFQIMFTSDEPKEIMDSQAEGLVKVDFINQALANELIKLAQEWNEGLAKIKHGNSLIRFLDSRENYINNIGMFVIPIFLMYLIYSYHYVLCNNLNLSNNFDLSTFQRTIIMFAAVYAFGNVLAKSLLRWFSVKVNKFKYENGILISKGDKIYLTELKEDNSKVLKDIVLKFIIALVVGIVMLILRVPIEKMLNLN